MAKSNEKEISEKLRAQADLIERGEWAGVIVISGNDGKLHEVSIHCNREAICHLLESGIKLFNSALTPLANKLADTAVVLTNLLDDSTIEGEYGG